MDYKSTRNAAFRKNPILRERNILFLWRRKLAVSCEKSFSKKLMTFEGHSILMMMKKTIFNKYFAWLACTIIYQPTFHNKFWRDIRKIIRKTLTWSPWESISLNFYMYVVLTTIFYFIFLKFQKSTQRIPSWLR